MTTYSCSMAEHQGALAIWMIMAVFFIFLLFVASTRIIGIVLFFFSKVQMVLFVLYSVYADSILAAFLFITDGCAFGKESSINLFLRMFSICFVFLLSTLFLTALRMLFLHQYGIHKDVGVRNILSNVQARERLFSRMYQNLLIWCVTVFLPLTSAALSVFKCSDHENCWQGRHAEIVILASFVLVFLGVVFPVFIGVKYYKFNKFFGSGQAFNNATPLGTKQYRAYRFLFINGRPESQGWFTGFGYLATAIISIISTFSEKKTILLATGIITIIYAAVTLYDWPQGIFYFNAFDFAARYITGLIYLILSYTYSTTSPDPGLVIFIIALLIFIFFYSAVAYLIYYNKTRDLPEFWAMRISKLGFDARHINPTCAAYYIYCKGYDPGDPRGEEYLKTFLANLKTKDIERETSKSMASWSKSIPKQTKYTQEIDTGSYKLLEEN